MSIGGSDRNGMKDDEGLWHLGEQDAHPSGIPLFKLADWLRAIHTSIGDLKPVLSMANKLNSLEC